MNKFNSIFLEEKMIPSNLRQCPVCNKNVSFLIFSDHPTEKRLHEIAKIMEDPIKSLNIPTWILGNLNKPPFDSEKEDMCLKVWPKGEQLFYATPDDFCDMLDDLSNAHCLH